MDNNITVEDHTTKTLVVKEIHRSIDLMDEFEDGDYDYLELQHWFTVSQTGKVNWNLGNATGRFYISLMISKKRNTNKDLCSESPTMTELRQMQHHYIYLDWQYLENSIDQIIQDACKIWEKDIFIELKKEIHLRAQTSWDRQDYGCEWLGGGDWEPKTLYGDTSDFYITGIILRQPYVYKSTEQEAQELLDSLKDEYLSNLEFLNDTIPSNNLLGFTVIHKSLGQGKIIVVEKSKITILFSKKQITFAYPDSVFEKQIDIIGYGRLFENLSDIWFKVKRIERLQQAIDTNDYSNLFSAMLDVKYGL